MISIRRILISLTLAVAAVFPSAAAKRTVRVAYFKYPGCHQVLADGTRVGYGADFYELLAKYADWKLEYVGYDRKWPEMLTMLDRGELDVVDLMEDTPDRRARYAFSMLPMAYSCTSMRTVKEKYDFFHRRDVDSWNRVKVGIIRGDICSARFAEFAADHNLDFTPVEFDEESLAADACRRGEVDLVAFDGFAPSHGLVHVGEIKPMRNHLVTRADDKELMAELDRAMMALAKAEPNWMPQIRGRHYPLTEITAYVPEGIDEPTRKYIRLLLSRLGELCSWDIVRKPCAADFSDADLDANSLGCGIYHSAKSMARFQPPRQAAGRRRADLYARTDDHRFDGGVVASSSPCRVGYVRSEAMALDLFLAFAAEKGVPYELMPVDSSAELKARLRAGSVDLALGPSTPNLEGMKSVAACGYIEFFFAPMKGETAMAHAISDALKFMQMDYPGYFLELEKWCFASDDDDDRHVRVAAYRERGLCYREGDGELTGLIPDLLSRIALHAGWNYTYISMTYPEAQRALAERKVDFMGAVTRTPERERVYDFSRTTMGPLVYSLMTRYDGKLVENSPSSWIGATIGVMHGSKSSLSLGKVLSEYDVTWRAVQFADLVEAEGALRRGEIDAVLTLPNADNRDMKPLLTVPTDLCYFASNPDKPWIGKSFDEELGKLMSSDIDWMEKLVSRHLRLDHHSFELTPAEIEFVHSCANRRFTLSFDRALPPMVVVDSATGRVGGSFRAFFDRISLRSGLKIDLLPPGSPADIIVNLNGHPKPDPTKSIECKWFQAPACWVRRKFGDPASTGVIAAVAGDRLSRVAASRFGLQVLECKTSEEAYAAVSDGRAETLVERLGVARYLLDEKGSYPDLYLQRIDTSILAYPIDVQFPSSADSRLRSVIDKARDSFPPGDYDAMVFEAIYGLRTFSVGVKTLIAVLLGILLVAGSIIFWTLYRARVARATNAAKTVFLNNMSHDIRTPMNAIMGFTNIAKQSLSDPARLEDSLGKIELAGARLLKLINEVLDISRVESGTVEITDHPLDLVAYLDSVGNMFGGMCSRKGLAFAVDHSRVRDRWVMADEKHFDQIVSNLVSNAVKYTNVGSVRLSCVQAEAKEGFASYAFTLEDTGVGMSKEFLRHIYEPFVRDSAMKAAGVEGTGLGMPIVRQLVDRIGGHIDIKSELGRGTSVKLSFTFQLCESPDAVANAVAGDGETGQRSLALRRVLLVEDNELNREIARFLLEGMKIVVDEAVNGAEAVEKVRAAVPGLYSWVLMDIQMPVMNGYEAAREIRKFNSTIPILAMTANAFAEDEEEALRSGMNFHLAKPIKADVLKAALTKFLK